MKVLYGVIEWRVLFRIADDDTSEQGNSYGMSDILKMFGAE